MLSIIYLIVILNGNLTIHEMPDMHMCESVGQQIQAWRPGVRWNCIEGAR